MPELFTRTEVDFGGAMHAQTGIVTPNNGLTGILMQNIQLSYQQQVTRLYELGVAAQRTKVYYVGGRAQGTMSVAHVIGPGITIAQFYEAFGDVCKARNNTCQLDLGSNFCDSSALPGLPTIAFPVPKPVRYVAKYCVLMSVGVSVSAQDFVINENSPLMFSGLEFFG